MRKYFIPLLSALPGVLAGTWIMYAQGISKSIYIQNIIYLMIGSLLSMVYMSVKCRITMKALCPAAVLNLLFLSSPFFFRGTDGVHRWFRLGTLGLNVAFISLPLLLIFIHKLLYNGHLKFCCFLVLAAAVILFLQPDASMISAFSIALIPVFYRNSKMGIFKYIFVILLILSGISWINIDHVEPVSYVEDIIVLAQRSGWPYLLCCILSIIILLLPFIKRNCGERCKGVSESFGLFFIVLILSTVPGNFPVPLIGYGISPIIGYLICVSYVEKNLDYDNMNTMGEG